MNKTMQSGLAGVFLSLIASVALADEAPVLPVDAMPVAALRLPASTPAQLPADPPESSLLTLGDSDLDGIVAARQTVTTAAQASALKGRVIAFSITELVASRLVSVSTATSVAVAVGVHPQALTSASAFGF